MRRMLIIMLIIATLLGGAALLLLSGQETASTPSAPVTRSAALGLVLLDQENGLYVLAISDQSPAERAGILAGDLLLRASDVPLSTTLQLEDFLSVRTAPFPLTLERGGRTMTLRFPVP